MTTAAIIAAALTVLQLFDGWTTYHVIKLGGRETNPVLLWLQAQIMRVISDERKARYVMLLATKGFAAALAWVVALVPIAHPNPEPIRLGLLVGLAALYVAIANNNWGALQRLKGRVA